MKRILGILVTLIVLGVGVAFAARYVNGLRNDRRDADIAAANERAAKDSTVRTIRREADSSVAVATRLAFQGELHLREVFGDSLTTLVTAISKLTIEGDSLRASVEGPAAVEDSAGVRVVQGEFDARKSLGVHVHADVIVPPPPKPVLWMWDVRREPLQLELALTCEGPQAVAQLAGPPWATLTLDSVVQTPDMCNPPVPVIWNPFAFDLPSVPVMGGLLGVGIVVGLVLGSR